MHAGSLPTSPRALSLARHPVYLFQNILATWPFFFILGCCHCCLYLLGFLCPQTGLWLHSGFSPTFPSVFLKSLFPLAFKLEYMSFRIWGFISGRHLRKTEVIPFPMQCSVYFFPQMSGTLPATFQVNNEFIHIPMTIDQI